MPLSRQQFLVSLASLLVAPATATPGPRRFAAAGGQATGTVTPLERPAESWRPLLTEAEYGVLFEADTEEPFSSPLNEEVRDGLYICAACHLPLFDSDTKFRSGTGWPSFYAPIAGRVETQPDFWLIIPRTEYHCVRCGGHQGHVFDDGPEPTGERWCNNGLALDFVPEGEPLPALRG